MISDILRRTALNAGVVALVAAVAGSLAPIASAGVATPAFSSATRSVTRAPSPAPTVTAIRVGRHTTFDRVVVNLSGRAPGYRVGYVSRLVRDPSGLPVDLRGPYSLSLVLTPANAHSTRTGRGTLTTPRRARPGLPEVREYAVIGDFEAVVSVGVGLAHKKPFRVQTLARPTRIVVDIRH